MTPALFCCRCSLCLAGEEQLQLWLEDKLQAELHVAVAAGPEDRVGAGGIGSIDNVAEPCPAECLGRIDVVGSSRSAGATEWVDKITWLRTLKNSTRN